MIEAYAFLAAFTVQILVVSVLHPMWLARYVRAKAEVQLPDWDRKSRDRSLTLLRVVNAGIAMLGLVLLGWLFTHIRSPDWDVGRVTRLLCGYVVLQILPFAVVSLIGAWGKRKALTRSPPEARRTASLQRRGLFDLVSPLIVFLCIAFYFLFAAFVVYIQHRGLPGFAGYRLLGAVTLIYALNGFVAYTLLYRRKKWPLETNAYRAHAVGVQVKIVFYTSIAVIVFLSLTITLRLLNMLRWVPFELSVYFVLSMLLTSMMLFALRRQAEADRLATSS
jgi:hypothetical protein